VDAIDDLGRGSLALAMGVSQPGRGQAEAKQDFAWLGETRLRYLGTSPGPTARVAPRPDPERRGAFLPNRGAGKSGLSRSILDKSWHRIELATPEQGPLHGHQRDHCQSGVHESDVQRMHGGGSQVPRESSGLPVHLLRTHRARRRERRQEHPRRREGGARTPQTGCASWGAQTTQPRGPEGQPPSESRRARPRSGRPCYHRCRCGRGRICRCRRRPWW
jgi:hypothetical protein